MTALDIALAAFLGLLTFGFICWACTVAVFGRDARTQPDDRTSQAGVEGKAGGQHLNTENT